MIPCGTPGMGKSKGKVCGIPASPYFSGKVAAVQVPLVSCCASAKCIWHPVHPRVSSGALPSCLVADVVVTGNRKEERPFFSHLCLSASYCYSSLPLLSKTYVQNWPYSLSFSPTHQ